MKPKLAAVLSIAVLGAGIQTVVATGTATATTNAATVGHRTAATATDGSADRSTRRARHRSGYVRAVLRDHPTALLRGLRDVTGHGPAGTAVGGPAAVRLPNGDRAFRFDGHGQYLQFSDRTAFEVDATGVLTVEFWMRPDALQFADEEGSGYVYAMGKGSPGQHEWYTRMYSQNNAESRPNRISGYAFNSAGGLGAGSYFQDPVRAGRWIHVALVINSRNRSAQFPMGYTRIYKNGVLRDTDSLADYDIVPKSGTAPLRIGTGYLSSFFQGAIGDVAFFNKELAPARIQAHNAARRSR